VLSKPNDDGGHAKGTAGRSHQHIVQVTTTGIIETLAPADDVSIDHDPGHRFQFRLCDTAGPFRKMSDPGTIALSCDTHMQAFKNTTAATVDLPSWAIDFTRISDFSRLAGVNMAAVTTCPVCIMNVLRCISELLNELNEQVEYGN